MKKYFYSDGKHKHGPVTIDELRDLTINKDTLIWSEGLRDWTPAGELNEFTPLLEVAPPTLPYEMSESAAVSAHSLPHDEEIHRTTVTSPLIETSEEHDASDILSRPEMFSKPFSFEGRIRRTEYCFSIIIYFLLATLVNVVVQSGEAAAGLAYIPLLWFLWAQGAKRCHDIGNSGWFQIIPFYVLWMMFASGEHGIKNRYGINPKL